MQLPDARAPVRHAVVVGKLCMVTYFLCGNEHQVAAADEEELEQEQDKNRSIVQRACSKFYRIIYNVVSGTRLPFRSGK